KAEPPRRPGGSESSRAGTTVSLSAQASGRFTMPVMSSPASSTPAGVPVRLQEPQAVLSPLTAAALFLVATIDPGGEAVVRDLLADLAGLERTVGFREPTAGLALVTGVGSDAWDRLFSGPRPAELHPFRELRGDR